MNNRTLSWVAILIASFIFCLPVIAADRAPRVCPVDGKEVNGDLHVDLVGLRLHACSEECLNEVINRGLRMRRIMIASGSEPERVPIHRSHDRPAELQRDMAFIKARGFARPGEYFVGRGQRT